jgi:Fe-S oxidoreductase
MFTKKSNKSNTKGVFKMPQVYNPGCALMLYKPHYADKILSFLNVENHEICCHHEPKLPIGTEIINTCPGCDKRFGSIYDGISTVSLWEVIAKSETFPFPDYQGKTMTIHDACPIRKRDDVHDAIRTLLKKMNVNILEAERNRSNSVCCGDSFYPKLPIDQVHIKMKERAESMPCEDVCVYCVSCVKSMNIGGRKPRYILDLLFGEETESEVCDTAEWHDRVKAYIEAH